MPKESHESITLPWIQAGRKPSVASYEEVDRLKRLLKDTARSLRLSGHPVKAALLLKELDRASRRGSSGGR
jgi:hypothetical protein